MKITPEEVMHVAGLARLRLDSDRVDKVAQQLADILTYVDTLAQVDTQDVPPTAHATALTNAFREDQVRDHLRPEEALANAPAKEGLTFVVPKVIASS
ncbi:MAG: Asp-tRNA(Asn)/Glu-tRNA(Gln) amidotransferase subunit GatC [Desulfatitalea sp.]|nr:Asp-tRNA(Asn)/Glu-tRNA(Gln) amidotransferase subunit GatC [Desulfatitalea sp.]NNJ99754.1 Asp-tRNA(Asn)/Glu-tRNA(Gln) amidotransferase subunit GatC [Desulfatitalea sp.]